MSLNLEDKKEVVAEVSERLKKAQTVVLAEYRGLPVEDITVLRSQARASGVYLRVLKNTLARRAVQGRRSRSWPTRWSARSPTASPTTRWLPRRCSSEYAKSERQARHQGRRDAQLRDDGQGGRALATMPSREELLAKLLGTMQAPVAKFVQTLNEVPTKFVRALAAVRDQKEKAAA